MDAQALGSVTGSPPTATTEAASRPAPTTKTADAPKSSSIDVSVPPRDPRTLQYQVDGSTREIVATIVDSSNKTVVVQIPSEEVLRIAQAIDRMKGFLLQGKA
jgi:flagellar protein FlaG